MEPVKHPEEQQYQYRHVEGAPFPLGGISPRGLTPLFPGASGYQPVTGPIAAEGKSPSSYHSTARITSRTENTSVPAPPKEQQDQQRLAVGATAISPPPTGTDHKYLAVILKEQQGHQRCKMGSPRPPTLQGLPRGRQPIRSAGIMKIPWTARRTQTLRRTST